MNAPAAGGRREGGGEKEGGEGRGDVSAALGEQAPQTRRKRVKAGGRQRLPRDHTVPPVPSCYPASALDDTEFNLHRNPRPKR